MPEGLASRAGVVGSIVRMVGRMPWSLRYKRVLPPGFDTTPVARESNIRNPNLPPPSRPEDEELIVRVDQRPGVPYPEWNRWTKAFIKDHVAVLERKLRPSSSVTKPINANLRRFFEVPTHRLMKICRSATPATSLEAWSCIAIIKMAGARRHGARRTAPAAITLPVPLRTDNRTESSVRAVGASALVAGLGG